MDRQDYAEPSAQTLDDSRLPRITPRRLRKLAADVQASRQLTDDLRAIHRAHQSQVDALAVIEHPQAFLATVLKAKENTR